MSSESRSLSLRGVGRVSRVIGFTTGTLWLVLTTLSVGFDTMFGTPAVLFDLPALALVIRSPMVGVRFKGETVVIASWLRTYRIAAAEVREVLSQHYSGYINRWADTDIMARHVRILGFDIGDDRFFPATAMTRRTADQVLPGLAARLGVEMTHLR